VGITKQKAAENREAIVTAADGLFRERGVDAVGLNELMGAAGLTRGGFYNHFASKDALVDTVLAKAMADGAGNLDRAITAAQARGSDPLTERIGWYLSPEHRADIEHGCPATASGARGQSHCSARWPAHCSSHVPSPTPTPPSPTKSSKAPAPTCATASVLRDNRHPDGSRGTALQSDRAAPTPRACPMAAGRP
jgi:AcrR family transcriptional regulator